MPATTGLRLSSSTRPILDTNMFKLVVFCALASVTAAQYYKDSKEAAIITDNRYLQGNGQHGSQYDQEDGTNFKEVTDQSGNRVGSYSYLDPSGQKHTVSYTAGKDGFRATGDGVPAAAPAVAPQPQYNPPAQNWNQQSQNWNQQPAQNWNNQQYSAPAVTERNWDESPNNKWDQWDDPGTWNNGADATPAPAPAQKSQWTGSQNLQWSSPAQGKQWNGNQQQQWASQQPTNNQQQWATQDLTADQKAWAAQNDNQQAQWAAKQQQEIFLQEQEQAQQRLAAQQPRPAWEQPAQPVQQPAQYPEYDPTTTTPAPHRFYPPGRLNLNRSPDGFSYTFNKA